MSCLIGSMKNNRVPSP